MYGRISAQYLLMSLSFCMMRYCGTIVIVVGTIMTATSIPEQKALTLEPKPRKGIAAQRNVQQNETERRAASGTNSG